LLPESFGPSLFLSPPAKSLLSCVTKLILSFKKTTQSKIEQIPSALFRAANLMTSIQGQTPTISWASKKAWKSELISESG
jgi:hypothetical protein